ncbi:HAD family hydrolase [uncultured Desulfobulbus sp.]|uniref:HAD family hydrolase n=1 Tax=uncultured Desulfobulbus sp. TaxID=239745 RepID=UPI0029C92627|nr:HAD family hydrolase [uncultured Desulfobulbus sp.]
MEYKAVIFDLFGTIVDLQSEESHKNHRRRLASILGVDEVDLGPALHQTRLIRDLGHSGSIEGDLQVITEALGICLNPDQVGEATRLRIRYFTDYLEPRSGAIETIEWLKSHRYKVGLISMCAREIPHVWDESPLAEYMDACVFSCLEGLIKPDKRIYQLVCDRLSVEPGDCLYIGDGSYRELAGAEEAGMHSIMIDRGMKGDCVDKHVHTDIEEWDGPWISRLTEIIGLLGCD